MIPLYTPPASVDSTSEGVIRIAAQSSEMSCTSISALLDKKVVPVLVPSMPQRSADFMQFAEEVAARLPLNPEFSDDWMNELVENLAQFDD